LRGTLSPSFLGDGLAFRERTAGLFPPAAERPDVEVELIVLPPQHMGLPSQVLVVALEVLLADLAVVGTGCNSFHLAIYPRFLQGCTQPMLELQFLCGPASLRFLDRGMRACWGRMKAGVKQQRSWLKAGAAESGGSAEAELWKAGVKSTSVGRTVQSALSRTREKRWAAGREGLSAMQLYKLVIAVKGL
jgi:hypothetical protein